MRAGSATPAAAVTADDITAAAAGDARALARLVPTLYRVARRYLTARLRRADPDDLADLTSEGVVKVVAHLQAARPESSAMFYAWVRAVVWRAALDACRARARRDAGAHAAGGTPAGGASRADANRACIDALPDGDALDASAAPDGAQDAGWPLRTLARLAVDAQAHLPADAPAILWAHLVVGEGWCDIAQRLGTTPAAAKRRYQRALAALRAAVWSGVGDLPPGEQDAVLDRLRAIDPRGPPARRTAGGHGGSRRVPGAEPDAEPDAEPHA